MWDAASLEGIRAFQTAYTVESASYCAERGRFAAGGDDMWVHLHDFATGQELEVNKGAPPGLKFGWVHFRDWVRLGYPSASKCKSSVQGSSNHENHPTRYNSGWNGFEHRSRFA